MGMLSGTSAVRCAWLSMAVVTALIAACERSADNGTPRAQVTAQRSALILDAAHGGGTPGFYFLPPMVDNPGAQGTFVAQADPTVSIKRLAEDGGLPEVVATYTMTSGTDGETIQVEGGTHFHVNWDTKTSELDETATYRISVSIAGREVGLADLDVVDQGNQLKNVDDDLFVPLLDGRTLPIKFSVYEPAAFHVDGAGGTVESTGGNGTFDLPPGALAAGTLISADPAGPACDALVGTVHDLWPPTPSLAVPGTADGDVSTVKIDGSG